MTTGTTSRTVHLAAGHEQGRRRTSGSAGAPPGSVTRKARPGLLPRLRSRSPAVRADHATCVMPAHPSGNKLGKAHRAAEHISQGGRHGRVR